MSYNRSWVKQTNRISKDKQEDIMNLKSQILVLLDQAAREEQAFIATLSDEQRAASGSSDDWGAKDVLIHIAFWKECIVESLKAAMKGESPLLSDDIDQINSETFERYRYDSWEKVIRRSEQASKVLIEQIHTLGNDNLNKKHLLNWQINRPLWRLIVENGFSHPISHLAEYYVKHESEYEGISYATKIQAEAAELLKELDDSPDWLGVVSYNLACHYLFVDEKDKAISCLVEAFGLAPELVQKSMQDPVLAPIQAELTNLR